jgi:tRNA1Val (adenine37-N6)-methyltransferase
MGLFPYRITRVKGNPQAPIKRSLLAFSFNRVTPAEELLVLEEARHQYTPEYLELVRDFYLKL